MVQFTIIVTTEYQTAGQVAARSKAWVCGRSLAGIAGSNPAGCGNTVCCHVEVSVTSRSFVQRCPTKCVCVCVCVCVSMCDQVQQ